jgi:hypothetical protein
MVCYSNRWRRIAAINGKGRCLSRHAAPFVETARTGVAEVAGTEEPPQAFRHGIEQLGQVFSGLEDFSRPPVPQLGMSWAMAIKSP